MRQWRVTPLPCEAIFQTNNTVTDSVGKTAVVASSSIVRVKDFPGVGNAVKYNNYGLGGSYPLLGYQTMRENQAVPEHDGDRAHSTSWIRSDENGVIMTIVLRVRVPTPAPI